MIRNLQYGPNTVNVQETTFTLDNMGRFLCNTLQEAVDSAGIQVAGKQRSFDTIVIGGGTFGAAIAASLPKTAAKLFRLASSWATEISFQSRYPAGIFLTKTGAPV